MQQFDHGGNPGPPVPVGRSIGAGPPPRRQSVTSPPGGGTGSPQVHDEVPCCRGEQNAKLDAGSPVLVQSLQFWFSSGSVLVQFWFSLVQLVQFGFSSVWVQLNPTHSLVFPCMFNFGLPWLPYCRPASGGNSTSVVKHSLIFTRMFIQVLH